MRDVGFPSIVGLFATFAGQAPDLDPLLKGANINLDRNLRLQYLAGLGLNNSQGLGIFEDLLKYIRGHDLRGLVRSPGTIPALEGIELERMIGDILNPEDVLKAARGCQAIIHAAAETRQWPTALRFYESNIVGTANVLAAARQPGIERLVHVSTVNVFARGTRERPGTESHDTIVDKHTPGYVVSKCRAQELVLDEARRHGLPALVINPSFMIGPRDFKPSSGRLIVATYGKRIRPYPPGGRNFVHVRDVAEAAVNALTLGRIGECYILGHENLTYREFFAKFSAVTRIPSLRLRIPGFLLKSFGMVSGLIAPNTTPLDTANARWLCAGHYYSTEKAVRELHLPQTPIETAIDEAVHWFQERGYLRTRR
jgi:dihydroflavonol-4-reductase